MKKKSIKLRKQWKNAFTGKRYDPSLRDQLYERSALREGEQIMSLIDAAKKAPFASSGTRAKWRRSVGL